MPKPMPEELLLLEREARNIGRSLWRRQAALGFPVTKEDMVEAESEAVVGMLKAVARFDPARGCALRKFARKMSAWEVLRFFRDRCLHIRVASRAQERGYGLRPRCLLAGLRVELLRNDMGAGGVDEDD